MKKTKIVRSISRIKLTLVEKDEGKRIELYNHLTMMARECQRLRNDTIRNLLFYVQSQNLNVDVSFDAKKLTMGKFIIKQRPEFKYLPNELANNAEYTVKKKFLKELKQYYITEKSYPMFKDLSLIIKGYNVKDKSGSKLFSEGTEYFLTPAGLYRLGITFKLVNLYKDKYAKYIVDGILEQRINFGMSRMSKGRNGIWYLYLAYSFEKEIQSEENDITLGIIAGEKHPLIIRLNNGYPMQTIGNVNQLQQFRNQLIRRKKNLIADNKLIRSGHGKKRKTQGLEKLYEKERNFINTYNHNLSIRVIEYCLQHNCHRIHIQKPSEADRTINFLSTDWKYFLLYSQIEYKAKERGIIVLYVDCELDKIESEDQKVLEVAYSDKYI